MKYRVLKPIRMKKEGVLTNMDPGQEVEVQDPQKVLPFIEGGYLKLISSPDQAGNPQAVKIRSKILNADVWIVTSPGAIPFVPEGEVYFLPEEIRNLRESSPEEIQAVYMVKKQLGGVLLAVQERREEKC